MKIVLLLLVFVSYPIYSSEVDNFSLRENLTLKDATDAINLHSNKLFDSVIKKTNEKNNSCNESELYKNLRKEFRNEVIGQFNRYIDESPDIERLKISIRNSIYGDFNITDSLILGFYTKYIKHKAFATIINIKGQYIGIDKFQHFAGTGFDYFENHYIKKQSIDSTLNIGKHDENGLLGAYTTGIISYGDMAAEFNGMRFWNNILAKNPDVLGNSFGPYVKCEHDQWIKVKEIDFSDYVDASWDEGLNCSNFRTKKLLRKVKRRLKKLEDVTGKTFTCPMDREVITNIIPKYGAYAEKMINIDGQKVEKN